MLLGTFHFLKDEAAHAFFSLIVSFSGYALGLLPLPLAASCFVLGILIDLDHVFNTPIARMINAPAKARRSWSGAYGAKGYTAKPLHGFDISLVIAWGAWAATSHVFFALFLYINLCVHELWDFLVYPHKWKELFLITRAATKFVPGKRQKFVGKIFTLKSLTY